MEKEFWLDRWEKNQTAFHESDGNTLLKNSFEKPALPPESRVFVPLCGKTLDISWLLSRGHKVVGVEFSRQAIEQLFIEMEVEPEIHELGKLERFQAPDLDIFVGDFFDLSPEALGPVQAVYDRAALVALPAETRARYSRRLVELTGAANQLLITFQYDQERMSGPPFSISAQELARNYGETHEIQLLESREHPGGIRGLREVTESMHLLRRRTAAKKRN